MGKAGRPEKKPVVALDGPSGAGKSTVSKAVTKRLGLLYLDTGALYRAIGWKALETGVNAEDADAMARLCEQVDITLSPDPDGGSHVRVDGTDVTSLIRTPEVSLAAAAVSRHPVVRARLLALQQDMGKQGGVLLDGRDIGTVVFPDAEVKIFLTASPEERARRRYEELKKRGADVSYDDTLADVEARDEADRTRPVSPLKQAPDAVLVDSTELSFEQVVDRICELVGQA